MMKYYYFLLFFLIIRTGLTQDLSEIDSLSTIVNTSSSDSVKMAIYNKLRRATYYTDASASKRYTKKYLEYAKKLKDSHNIVLARFFLGNAALMSGDYDQAVNDYLFAANYYQRKKDSSRLTSVLNSLGAVYEKTEQDSLSLKYYKQARANGKSLSDFKRSGIASVNIGNIFIGQKKLDSAKFYLDDAIKDLKTNPKNQSFLIIAETNLANVYGQSNAYKKGLDLYDSILKKIDTTADIYNHANILRGKSNIFSEQKKFKMALPLLEKAQQKYITNNFEDEHLQAIPELIYIYKNTNNYRKAVDLYEDYINIKDSILYTEQEQNIADAITKYETEKKDAQLKLLELEKVKSNQRQLLLVVLAIAGLSIAGLIGFFLYKNRKKNNLLAQQKKILEKTVDEKNVLLKETHHRVKNSFQMVASLLSYQAINMKDSEAKLAIREAQNRVRSMVLIHQKLYSKDQLIGIDTKEYFKDFTEDFFQSHEYRKKRIKADFNLDSIVLDIESITPLGLILNELLTNVIKHAFIEEILENKVTVSFQKVDETLVLTVTDNGKGITAEIADGSYGIKLIKTLAKKLQGQLRLSHNEPCGTVATLTVNRFNIL